MKTTKFADCECGGTVSLVNEGSIRYPRLRIACDKCKNKTPWYEVCKTCGTIDKNGNYDLCYKRVLNKWNTYSKFLNGLKYEYFCDTCYFDTYLVRDKKDRKFGEGWSVFSSADAIELCNILNKITPIDKSSIRSFYLCNEDKLFLEVNGKQIRFINQEEKNDVEKMLIEGIIGAHIAH